MRRSTGVHIVVDEEDDKMDALWQDVIPEESSGLGLVISLRDGRQLKVLAVWIGPGGYRGVARRVPVVKVAGLPDWCKAPDWPEDGIVPYKQLRGTLQLATDEDPDCRMGSGLWRALEIRAHRRARQRDLTFIPRCYNSEPSEGPCYTLYNVPDLDIGGIAQLVSSLADNGCTRLEVF